MLRHTFFFGSLIGCAVAVPFVYQANPTYFRELLNKEQPAQLSYASPSQPIRPQSQSLGSKVVIPMDSRGHFITDFKLNGYRVEALVDTGATYVAINRTVASRIGVRITADDMKYKVTTANGKAAAAAINIDEVAIGRIRVRNVPALVLEDRALNGILMGMSFLKELDRFAIEDRSLVLEQ